jgi:hypothetical protein
MDQLIAGLGDWAKQHGRWLSSDTLASSTTKTGDIDIAEILMKVALKHNKSIHQSIAETKQIF